MFFLFTHIPYVYFVKLRHWTRISSVHLPSRHTQPPHAAIRQGGNKERSNQASSSFRALYRCYLSLDTSPASLHSDLSRRGTEGAGGGRGDGGGVDDPEKKEEEEGRGLCNKKATEEDELKEVVGYKKRCASRGFFRP